MANLKLGGARLAPALAGDVQLEAPGHRLTGPPLPQRWLFHHLALASAVGADPPLGTPGGGLRRLEQLVDIGFAVAHAEPSGSWSTKPKHESPRESIEAFPVF
jgi:hypothetical protein